MKTFVYEGYGIPDEAFVRGSAPMTKEEVRSVTLAKLHPGKDEVALDVGAGTGSVSVELACCCRKVYAAEMKEDALALLGENRRRFGRDNLEVLAGPAPDSLAEIQEDLDILFLGGTGGNLQAIMDWADGRLKAGGKIAANFITLENAVRFLDLLREKDYGQTDVALVQVAKGRGLGGLTMLMGQNPVYIISARRKRHEEI